jgi:hypothetical protein
MSPTSFHTTQLYQEKHKCTCKPTTLSIKSQPPISAHKKLPQCLCRTEPTNYLGLYLKFLHPPYNSNWYPASAMNKKKFGHLFVKEGCLFVYHQDLLWFALIRWVLPKFVLWFVFFLAMNQFDWPVTQKKEKMEVPQNRRFYFEAWSSSLLAGL